MAKQNPQSKPASDPDLSAIRSADITFEEQVEIIGEINEVMEKNRLEITPETFAFTPKKKGSLIPMLINGGALLVLALGAFSLLAFFNREERSLIRESSTVLSAEGKLIAALRRESEQQLNQKDRQIADIQIRLEELRRDAETAKLDTEARIRDREEELRTELEAQLESERQKLQGEGLSSAAIADQLRGLEQRLTIENENRLAAFRSRSEAELAEKEEQLAALEEQYRRSQLERNALQQQYSQREAELREQLARQAAAAESAQAEVADQLAELREQRRQEQLAADQILSFYNRVQDALQGGRYEAALSDLDNLESYLARTSIATLPSVRDRIPTERFLITSLRRLIELRRAEASSTGTPPAQTTATATEGGEQVSSAALSRVQAELERTRASLSRQTRELDQLRSTLDQRSRELNRVTATLDRRSRELDQAQTTINRQNQQITAYENAQRQIAALRQEVSSLRQRYTALSARGGTARVSQAKVLDLVDTKLKVREVLSSEPVRREYPELYDAMEDYFDTYGTVQLQAGQEEALDDAIEVLDDLLGSGSADLSAMKRSYAASPEGDRFAEFLQKLEALLK
ncbi:MAG: hypothetical protein JXB06_12975 [Spirochaetales bacterium]|nr:hypothetical protein [Spirochaetales bacterium]